ncbi:MAG: nuclear transport factor 2 family protein, partial [Actinomycetota bacterium]|nr:nuclear transport factor 2 family protein [Actinomycetota bacterium]
MSADELFAKAAIRKVLQDYCRAVDRIDRPLGLSVFHPGATVDFVGIFTGTGEGWIDTVLPAHLNYAGTSHQVTNLTVAFEGDSARSETYVTARIRSYPDEAGRRVDMVVAGRYLDRWSKRDGRWAIDHRHYVNDVHSEHEVVGGMEETAARRDRDDPLYAFLGSAGASGDGGLEALLAEQAIREVLQNYGRGLDRVDRALTRSVFHPGATVDFVGIWAGEADEWVDVVSDAHLGYCSLSHQITNVTVALDGDTAASEGYVTARVRSYPEESGRRVDMVVSGRYLDRWSRRDGVWAIDHRMFASDIHSLYEVVDGLDEPTGRRDPEDAGYALLGADPRPAPSTTAEELLAKQAIRDVLQNYCRAIDRYDRELARTLWHPGAMVDYVGILEGTAEEFMEWIWKTHADFDATSHQITNVTVALDGDAAASEASVTVRVRRKDEAGRPVDLWASGRYLDRWSLRDGTWAIDSRIYV